MKGKYINTVIMMAALSGKKVSRNTTKETLTSLNDHRIIWRKKINAQSVTNNNGFQLID